MIVDRWRNFNGPSRRSAVQPPQLSGYARSEFRLPLSGFVSRVIRIQQQHHNPLRQ